MKRLLALVAAVIAFAPASVAAAEEEPEIVSIVDKCPVSEGGYQYSADFFEYRILVWLADCPWYHGERVVVRGSLTRTDPVVGKERHAMKVYCEPGAPPVDEGHHSTASTLPGVTVPAQGGTEHEMEARRPPDNCALSIVVPHPTVEHARYDGELHYPSGQGDQHETLVLECTNVHQFGGCDPPGRPPGFSPA